MNKKELLEKINKEGHLRIFMHAGYVCVVMRPHTVAGDLGKMPWTIHLCGYVGIPKGHPLYGKDYWYIYDNTRLRPQVHGGLTYSREYLLTREKSGLWWFGFDAAHAGDTSSLDSIHEFETYKDMDYMIKETKKLARWLKRVERRSKK